MPELPEVETTCQGLSPHIKCKKLTAIVVRHPTLRWPIPTKEMQCLSGETLLDLTRRGKYLLFRFPSGTIIGHLGMSGNMRVTAKDTEVKKHDHVDFVFESHTVVRLNDPRRFGAILFTTAPPEEHPLLNRLGPEPLSEAFDTEYLFKKSRNKAINIKTFIMNSQVVVGVGNIYASESLFMAGIRPLTETGKISRKRMERLVQAIKEVLGRAIESGGTTLKDFVNSDGKPGYFQQKLNVYGKRNEQCNQCASTIKEIKQNGRATFYCPRCQR